MLKAPCYSHIKALMDDDDFAFMQFLANDDNLYNDEIFDLAAVATYLLAGISAHHGKFIEPTIWAMASQQNNLERPSRL